MPGDQIRLLSLDGGGVRGLSSLMIIRQLMETVDPEAPPKPCDYFDLIGGTSTGGLIAVMLGRLHMTVDECIEAYTSLSDKVFEKKAHRVKINGQFQGRFDTAALERAIKKILCDCGLGEDALLKDIDGPCKVFVCAASKQTSNTVCLTSYRSPRGGTHLLDSTKIWEACRATSAATTFFEPIAIGPFNEEFVDGAMGSNNPIYSLWTEAQDLWGADQLQAKLTCLVSIGTGVPSLQPLRDDIIGIGATLKVLVTETEKTAEQFRRDKCSLYDEGRYYRFNVDSGLETIGLHESKKKNEIAAATRRYIESQEVFKQMQACAGALARKKYHGPYKTEFTMLGMPISDNFVNRPSDTAEIERCLLSQQTHSRSNRRRVFVLHGLGGIGKTQLAVDFARRHRDTFSSVFWLDGRSEVHLRQSIAACAHRIPGGQIPESSREPDLRSEKDLDRVIADVLKWLSRPDNSNWLLVFDNVDLDYEQDQAASAYDVRQYLPSDHGAVLVTTRLARLVQLGSSMGLKRAQDELSKAIFQQWLGTELVIDESANELLRLLHGLPLALTQAASYMRETGVDIATYLRLYQKHWGDWMDPDSDLSPLVDYEHRSVGTTWTISFEAIMERNPAAGNLLRLFAFLDNRGLRFSLFQAVTNSEEWPSWLYEVTGVETRFLDATRLLLRYSMIETHESLQDGYLIHPVVHKWTAHMQDASCKRQFLRLAVLLVESLVDSSVAKGDWSSQFQISPHAQSCAWWVSNTFEIFRDSDPQTLNAYNNLGCVYQKQGRFPEAETLYLRALEGFEKIFGYDHPQTLGTYNNLGIAYQDQGRFPEAETLHLQTLEGYKEIFGDSHPTTFNTYNNLGYVYQKQGRCPEAETLHIQVLEGYKKIFGDSHPQTLNTYNNLGCVYQKQGRFPEAETLYLQALEGHKKIFGDSHPTTLGTYNNLAIAYKKQGRFPEAETLYLQVLEGYEKTFGDNHPTTLSTYNNLAIVYQKQGRFPEAETLYLRALEGYEKTFVYGHLSTFNTMKNLGGLYGEQGRLPEAEDFFSPGTTRLSRYPGVSSPTPINRRSDGMHKYSSEIHRYSLTHVPHLLP
ncbi:hypothetical protein GQ53DRAFT_860990 [Thozetella sp. PMI_491]|nr:hypothetical protein GQ53DRAFT_860990 [Thozetella sp. PMI_491]